MEWARIEPAEGVFDPGALDHYRAVTFAVLAAGLVPMVTLNHFSLPAWLGAKGGWLAPDAPALFTRYAETVVRALGDRVPWYCTINEPGVVAFGGYIGALDFPPGRLDGESWRRASDGLIAAHRRALPVLRDSRPDARFGLTHSMQAWEADAGGQRFVDFIRRRNEDVFLEAAVDDDFVGVQTYTRVQVRLASPLAAVLGIALRSRRLTDILVPPVIRSQAKNPLPPVPAGARRTQMGYEFSPEAVVATLRRVADLLPGKDLIVTEHGVATADDAERVEFIDRGLRAIHAAMADGLPVRGYIHWSLLDNFEWARGYAPTFGLVGVDRTTLERTVRPSARFLGEIARTGRISGA